MFYYLYHDNQDRQRERQVDKLRETRSGCQSVNQLQCCHGHTQEEELLQPRGERDT